MANRRNTRNNYRPARRPRRKSGAQKWVAIFFIALIAVGIFISFSTRREAKADSRSAQSETVLKEQTASVGFPLTVSLPAGLTAEEIDYTGFTVSFNRDNHTPNYSAWELLGSETNGSVKRSNNFLTDERVAGCPTTRDYTRSGYDRGHMTPANDQKWSEEAMNDCFYMTNMCPQDHDLNNGAWKTLETKSQLWARRDSVLYIVAGPIYTDGDRKRIGDTGVRVPSSFFKVIVAPTKKRGIAFVYPNSVAPGNMADYSCTIDEVEALTGYNFFPEMSPEIEREIEAVASFKEWNRAR